MANSLFENSLVSQIEELLECWSLWEDSIDFYVSELIPSLQNDPSSGLEKEAAVMLSIRSVATAEEWRNLPALIEQYMQEDEDKRQARVRNTKEVCELLDRHLTDEADRRSIESRNYFNPGEYARLRSEAIGIFKAEQRSKAEEAARMAAEEAVRIAEEAERVAAEEAVRKEEEKRREDEEARLVAEHREREREREEERQALAGQQAPILNVINPALRESIEKADRLNEETNREGFVDYEVLKTNYLENWLSARFQSPSPAEEQVAAIGKIPASYLLRARAGSGKTFVITAKARMLMEHERVPPDQIMILAFNKKAAREVTQRIRREQKQLDFNNARTFHSLAHQLVKPKSDLLYDESTGSNKKQSDFVQRLINTVMNPALLAQIYIFFRQEIKELEDVGAFLSKEDYYAYRRNHVQDALGGQQVKSIGEKWLADFLFEHGIRFIYEKVWYWDDKNEGNYRPDFSIFTDGKFPNIVIEHWGIDLNDRRQQVPEHWDKSWQEYRQQVDKKREYWKRFNSKNPDQQVLFLETSIADLRAAREGFENVLRRKLTSANVDLDKLPEDELEKRVVTSRIGRFSTMCLQYIQKAKKQRLTPKDMAEKISTAADLDMKTKSFLRIANNLYARYQKALAAENKTDFDDLMESAIGVVHQDEGNCQIRIDEDRYIAMNELRWIMVDEYQDFSRLFYGLIDAIRTYNRSVNLFCVGDDWQAINAFAGSDLHFFDQFQSLISGAETGDLRNNYRSAHPIVQSGNRFMHGKGQSSVATRADLHGKVETCHTDKIWIEQRRLEEYAEERVSDERFYTYTMVNNEKRRTDTGLRIGRMLKKCHEILTRTDYDKDTTFAVLSRVERLGTGYPNWQAFHRKLKETLLPDQKKRFGDFDSRVHCGTVHSYKGLEADVVIVLGVNERNFPKIHPDNELYSIFGVTPTQVLAEEERLFYVAITRAKKYLYLFTETGRESVFLNRL